MWTVTIRVAKTECMGKLCRWSRAESSVLCARLGLCSDVVYLLQGVPVLPVYVQSDLHANRQASSGLILDDPDDRAAALGQVRLDVW